MNKMRMIAVGKTTVCSLVFERALAGSECIHEENQLALGGLALGGRFGRRLWREW